MFIGKRMFFLSGSDLFKPYNNRKYELLIRFPRNNKDNVFRFGAPFLNKWTIAYDYEAKEIAFYGQNFINLDSDYFWYKFWRIA